PPSSRGQSLHCCCGAPRALPSFPPRRSSDLERAQRLRGEHRPDGARGEGGERHAQVGEFDPCPQRGAGGRRQCPGGSVAPGEREDRKSTRLNSSHVKISYAVFCLKKKNETDA